MQQQQMMTLGFQVLVSLIWMASCLQVFHKAGVPAWHAIIPVYNVYRYIKVAGKSGWFTLGYFVPVVSIVFHGIVNHGMAKSFGKGMGFTLGLTFLPFFFLPYLAFSKIQYLGAGGARIVTPPPFNKHHLLHKQAA